MRNYLNEKKTIRSFLTVSLIGAIVFSAGYLVGTTMTIKICAETAARTLIKLGITMDNINELIQRYIWIGQRSG